MWFEWDFQIYMLTFLSLTLEFGFKKTQDTFDLLKKAGHKE